MEVQTEVELAEIPGSGIRGTIALRDLAAGENALSLPLHLHVNIGYKNWSDAVRCTFTRRPASSHKGFDMFNVRLVNKAPDFWD